MAEFLQGAITALAFKNGCAVAGMIERIALDPLSLLGCKVLNGVVVRLFLGQLRRVVVSHAALPFSLVQMYQKDAPLSIDTE